jgi:UDP-N-acetylglucosamine--N-acetylmuramyl-(pentapeptide) pyrophosphoryl-undecaprenol N-acetylglucosamine transferase
MEDAYAVADLVLSRAGGSTLAEVAALGLPAVLVPYPHAADRHQHANATGLVRAGAAWMIDQDCLTPDVLAHSLQSILGDTARLEAMGGAARRIARPDAAETVARRIVELAGLPAGTGTPADPESHNHTESLAA